MEHDSEASREAIFDVIENQIRDNDPPITKDTYGRLKAAGHTHEETMKLIGCALSVELFEMMKNGESFSEQRYTYNLNQLPELPWED